MHSYIDIFFIVVLVVVIFYLGRCELNWMTTVVTKQNNIADEDDDENDRNRQKRKTERIYGFLLSLMSFQGVYTSGK
jgi:Na+/H+ antiporter NhaB